MRILIAEDDFISRRLMVKFLAMRGTCEIAVNGKEAIEAFSLAWEEGHPYSVIFLDVMMPEMDGLNVLKKIRQAEKEKGIRKPYLAKIIMTTAKNDSTSVMEAIQSGCNAYLVKPIDEKKLSAKLRELGLAD